MASVSAAGGINSAGKSVVTCQWYKCCCCSGRKLLFSPCDRSIRVSLALVLASTRSVSSVCWCSTLLTAASALPSSEWQCHNVYSLPSLHRHSLPNTVRKRFTWLQVRGVQLFHCTGTVTRKTALWLCWRNMSFHPKNRHSVFSIQ